MSNFIKAKGQNEIVNLDKVFSILPKANVKSHGNNSKTYHKIYFSFSNEEGYVVWKFENKDEYDKVMSFLEGGMTLEILQ